jgi:large subunit ribosomal protein L28
MSILEYYHHFSFAILSPHSTPFQFEMFRRFYSNVARLGRAERGLYAGCGLSFGKTISEFGNRNPRTWKPNIQRASLYSAILRQRISLRVSTEALRQIDRLGGLDNYLIEQKLPESECARKLKNRILARKLELDG